jgi:prevent-host-death family protein
MRSFAVFEAKNRFSELVAAAANGEEITITRHGSPVARLMAMNVTAPSSVERCKRVASQIGLLRSLGQSAALGCSLQEAIQEGRD